MLSVKNISVHLGNFHLDQITFDINLPWIHESFHATRRRVDVSKAENDEWYTEVPLIVDGRIFGRVELIASKRCRFSHYDIISNLLKLTADFEPQLRSKAELNEEFAEAAVAADISSDDEISLHDESAQRAGI